MRSGWPHTQDDHGRLPVDPRQAQFGPETSWPNGYPALEYRDGDHRYPASRQALPPAGQGEHPYAAFSAAGYGDDGYRDPGYDGPASQDAGIAGTRTVRGFVEEGPARPGYALPAAPQSGYARPGYPPAAQPGYDYGQPGHAAGGRELPYPMPLSAETYPVADTYRQPWDYDQPLRYDGEEAPYPVQDSYGSPDSYQQPADYGRADSYGQADRYDNRGYDSGAYRSPAYDPAQYNGSDYSMPGINGPGYDLSGIIGTGDFEAFGYDEPRHDRLAYDDPRYDETPGYGGSRYDAPRDDARGGPLRRDAVDDPASTRPGWTTCGGARTTYGAMPQSATGTMGSGETAAAVRDMRILIVPAALGSTRPGWTCA